MVMRAAACGQEKYVFREPKMGSPFTITVYGDDSARVAKAATEAFLAVDSLNGIFSDYLPESELNRLSRRSGSGKYTPVSPVLFRLLRRSKKASRLSRGSFDVTIGAVVRLWRHAMKEKVFPDADSLRAALATTGYRHMRFREKDQAVRLDLPGTLLDLGGIAKGYIAGEALRVLRARGFSRALVNAGGDIAAGSPPPGQPGWRIGIAVPEQASGSLPETIFLRDGAVATSGNIYQNFFWKGKHYSHIIDPKTGLGVTSARNVTVLAPDGATADWLASACSVLSVPRALKLIRRIHGAALCIVEKRGDSLYRTASRGFKDFIDMKPAKR